MTSILWNINLENSVNRIFNTNEINKPMQIIEIGCFEGFGTLKLNELFGKNVKPTITCIDPFDDCYVKNNHEFRDIDPIFVGQFDKFINNVKSIQDNIIIKRGYSNDILPTLTPKSYDFIYIDGDHSEQGVYQDAVNSLNLVKSDGIILFDDYEWQHKSQLTKNGIEKFICENNDKIMVLFRGPVQCAVKII